MATVVDELHVLLPQFVKFGTKGLENGRKSNGFVYQHRAIADPEFNGFEERMHANIPPDLFGIIDAVRFYEQLYVIIVIFQAGKIPRNTGARKFIEHLGAERFVTRIAALPKR